MKKYLIVYIISGALATITIIGAAFAWFTNTRYTNPISTVTNGIQFTYDVSDMADNEIDLETEEYVTFYDLDNEAELDDFNYGITNGSMLSFKIVLNNTGTASFNYTISNLSNGTGTAYIACIFSTIALTPSTYSSLSATTVGNVLNQTTISTFGISMTGTLNGYNGTTVDSDTYYVYVIGVQTDDLADNDFLDDTYNFRVGVLANQIGGN